MTVLSPLVIDTIGSLVAASSPLVFAGIGEVLTERVGVVNLSLDGSILLRPWRALPWRSSRGAS